MPPPRTAAEIVRSFREKAARGEVTTLRAEAEKAIISRELAKAEKEIGEGRPVLKEKEVTISGRVKRAKVTPTPPPIAPAPIAKKETIRGRIEAPIKKTAELVIAGPPKAPEKKGLLQRVVAAQKREVIGKAAFGAGAVTAITTGILRPVETAKGAARIVTQPREVIRELGVGFRTQPFFTAGQLVGTRYLFKGAGKLGRIGLETTAAVVSPKFVRAKKAPELGFGVERVIKVPSEVVGRKAVTIKVVKGFKAFEEPLAKQAKIAGVTVDAVSAQRSLFKAFQRKKIVEKPLPTPGAPPLERAFFADPAARLRPSRLGITEAPPTATISEIITGKAALFRKKPQALLFERAKVAGLPKDIRTALTRGRPLTPSQEARLLSQQLRPTGRFQPIGFLSREPEITLAPGTIIKRGEMAGVTLLKGRRVPIFRAKIEKAPKPILDLLKKEKLTKKELSMVAKETGFPVSRLRPAKPVIRAPLTGVLRARPRPRPRPIPSISPRPPSRPAPSPISLPKPIVRPSPVPRVPGISITPPPKPTPRPRIIPGISITPTPSPPPPRGPRIGVPLVPPERPVTTRVDFRVPPPITRPIRKVKPTKRKRIGLFDRRLVPFSPKYFSSIEASVFKITGERPTPGRLATGIVVRPIAA